MISFLRLKKPANQAVLEKRDNPPSVSVKRNKLTELLSFWVVADVRRAGLRDSVVYPGESQSDRIWQKFLARHIDFESKLGSERDTPSPVRRKADISEVGAILRCGIAGAISLSSD